MSERPQLELAAALSLLYQSHDYADLTIIDRDGNEHIAHKAIVCPRSTFFAHAVKARQWHADTEGEIACTDHDPHLIRYILQYMYLLDYGPPPPSPSAPSLVSHDHDSSDSTSTRTDARDYGQVYGAAAISAFGGPQDIRSGPSPYLVPYGHARDRSESQLTVHAIPGVADFTALSHANNQRRRTSARSTGSGGPEPSPLATEEPHLVLHAEVFAVAEHFGIPGLKALALDKFKIQLTRHWNSSEFAEAIHVVYTTPTSDRDLKEVVADTIGWHGSLLSKPEIEVAIMDINGLAYELLKRSRRIEPEYMMH